MDAISEKHNIELENSTLKEQANRYVEKIDEIAIQVEEHEKNEKNYKAEIQRQKSQLIRRISERDGNEENTEDVPMPYGIGLKAKRTRISQQNHRPLSLKGDELLGSMNWGEIKKEEPASLGDGAPTILKEKCVEIKEVADEDLASNLIPVRNPQPENSQFIQMKKAKIRFIAFDFEGFIATRRTVFSRKCQYSVIRKSISKYAKKSRTSCTKNISKEKIERRCKNAVEIG